ncbi:hypothetical protein DASC09_059840 [Saccharomycopsis crataegensis]|uniref:Uncharacterized protein n=1 Tax=Saccharomycopsis crataegensis TaxID=43959 RepID=A0AAV5QWZ7_9ASCO|nr:hypothetical protein DASC09_059840 [Saccharomycopsis crataegensis]
MVKFFINVPSNIKVLAAKVKNTQIHGNNFTVLGYSFRQKGQEFDYVHAFEEFDVDKIDSMSCYYHDSNTRITSLFRRI